MENSKKYLIFIPIITALLSFTFLIINNPKDNLINKTYTDFSEDLDSNNVSSVTINKSTKIIIAMFIHKGKFKRYC